MKTSNFTQSILFTLFQHIYELHIEENQPISISPNRCQALQNLPNWLNYFTSRNRFKTCWILTTRKDALTLLVMLKHMLGLKVSWKWFSGLLIMFRTSTNQIFDGFEDGPVPFFFLLWTVTLQQYLKTKYCCQKEHIASTWYLISMLQ